MAEVLDSARYVLAVFVVIAYPPSIAWWFLVHPFVSFWRRLGKTPSLWLLAIFLLGSMAALYPIADDVLRHDYGTRIWTFVAALPFLVVSGWIAKERRRYLTFAVLAGAPELEAGGKGGTLFTEGIYARIRHPRYVEFVLGGAGWALIINYLEVYLLHAALVVAIFLIVPLEERELRARFGAAYDAYAQRVPRFVPRA